MRAWLRRWLGIEAEEHRAVRSENDLADEIKRARFELKRLIDDTRQHGDEQSLALSRRISALDTRLSAAEGPDRARRVLANDAPRFPGF